MKEPAPATVQGVIAICKRAVRRHPSAWLLGIQLLGVVLYPAMDSTAKGRAVFGAFGIIVLALALWVVNRSPSVNWIAWLLAVPSVALSIAAAVTGNPGLNAFANVLEAALYFYTAASLIRYMLLDHDVSTDELYAAGATFTLLAWGFAFAFSVCEQWAPGSFAAAGNVGGERTWMEFLSLSFSLLSGVGLSDIVPLRSEARSIVMLEQFTGVMYIALVVSRIVGLTTMRMATKAAERAVEVKGKDRLQS